MDPRSLPAAMRGAVDLSGLVRQASAPSPAPRPAEGSSGSASGAAGSGFAREADDASFGAVLELSQRVPVVVEFYAAGIEPALEPIVAAYGGRLALVTVDGNRAPQVAQAFQVQQVPAVAAVIGGRPLQLFVGMPGEAEVRQVLDQVLELFRDPARRLAMGRAGRARAEATFDIRRHVAAVARVFASVARVLASFARAAAASAALCAPAAALPAASAF